MVHGKARVKKYWVRVSGGIAKQQNFNSICLKLYKHFNVSPPEGKVDLAFSDLTNDP